MGSIMRHVLSARIQRLAALLAAALLGAQAAAVTHEYDHALHKHDAPCALHIYADHSSKAAPASVPAAPCAAPAGHPLPDAAFPTTYGLLAACRARAPPLFSPFLST